MPDSTFTGRCHFWSLGFCRAHRYFRDARGKLIPNQRVRTCARQIFFVDSYFQIDQTLLLPTLLPFRLALRLALENLFKLLYVDTYKMALMSELTISEARKVLLNLPEKLARTSERAMTITRRGRPVLAILPWEFYESIVETLEILGDPEMVQALRESLEDLKGGRVVSNAEAKKRLGV